MARDLLILSTEASAYFADLIRHQLHKALPINIERKTFGGGERYFRIEIDSRDQIMGKNVVFVGSTHTDDDFMELARVGSALAMYGAHSLIFCIPFFGYSRMERADKPGEVVTAKTHARLLSAIPQAREGNTFLLLDTHVPNLVHYFEGSCLRHELKSAPLLTNALKYSGISFTSPYGLKRAIFGTTDLGRPKSVKEIAKQFGCEIALIDKDREGDDTKVTAVIGDVDNALVIMCDDLCGSGSSAMNAAQAYLQHGATVVHFVVNHFSLNSQSVFVELAASNSPIQKIITTNSHPMSYELFLCQSNEKVVVVDVSPLFVDQIRQIIG